jgi:hypothetical protein
MILASAAGITSNLELVLPLVVVVALGAFWHDIATSLEHALRKHETADEFDEDTTLEEWLEWRFPEHHLTLLDRPEAK